MIPPKRHDLKTFDFDFEGNGFSSDQWEISVPQNHCIIWSVVLPYLISADPEDEQQFEKRLCLLTGDDINPEKAKSAIWQFNPFLSGHNSFSNVTLRKLTRCFRKVLENNGSTKRSKTAEVWPLIASLLKCKLLLISFRSKTARLFVANSPSAVSTDNVESITCTDTPATMAFNQHENHTTHNEEKTTSSLDLPTLTVFFTEIPSSRSDVPLRKFSFGLSEDVCLKLRESSLIQNVQKLDTVSNKLA